MFTEVLISMYRFVNNNFSTLTQTRFYGVIPALAIATLTDFLITVSLCILLYGNGPGSALPSTKRLVNRLIIYAINRCLLTLAVAIAELAVTAYNQDTWGMGLDFNIGKLYANSLLASLNTRQCLRHQGSSPNSLDLRMSTVHFADPPKLPGDVESSEDRERCFKVPEMAVIDITSNPIPDKTMAL
ncbi:hypothetical protein BKA82DRAFT_279562 [Pisolithus tinctorius]|uniref:DUF6534 domain-containing protein n=1 Tax=Pisolithus tinctorius Marx 270 TaxID=870435 RepID=A0A0C3PMR7_PISTI|nr:hypothetical protein BKA82DRAFT_279562 [Pisolithus tinctorius]KIO09654.1 hypothetical protein M404DRAFT_279562 [Pisolithus tinctorius Marx 270]